MNRTDDVRAVRAILDAYVSGTETRNSDALRTVFHSACVMSGYLGPNKLIGSLEPFLDHLDANEHSPGYTSEIVEVSVTGRTAKARIVEDNLYGMNFVNDMHLINDDGVWLIVSKLFHHD